MSRATPLILLAALAAAAAPARADDAAVFMGNFAGAWLGSGQVLIGGENGMKFGCELDGDPSRTMLTFSMSGRCWMGKLSAPVHAQLRYNVETRRFYGQFMDGAQGDGVDIVGDRADEGVTLQLTRGAARGRLVAEPVNADQMRVTMYISEPASKREIPVAAMGFTRKGTGGTLPQYLPEVTTGAIGRSAK